MKEGTTEHGTSVYVEMHHLYTSVFRSIRYHVKWSVTDSILSTLMILIGVINFRVRKVIFRVFCAAQNVIPLIGHVTLDWLPDRAQLERETLFSQNEFRCDISMSSSGEGREIFSSIIQFVQQFIAGLIRHGKYHHQFISSSLPKGISLNEWLMKNRRTTRLLSPSIRTSARWWNNKSNQQSTTIIISFLLFCLRVLIPIRIRGQQWKKREILIDRTHHRSHACLSAEHHNEDRRSERYHHHWRRTKGHAHLMLRIEKGVEKQFRMCMSLFLFHIYTHTRAHIHTNTSAFVSRRKCHHSFKCKHTLSVQFTSAIYWPELPMIVIIIYRFSLCLFSALTTITFNTLSSSTHARTYSQILSPSFHLWFVWHSRSESLSLSLCTVNNADQSGISICIQFERSMCWSSQFEHDASLWQCESTLNTSARASFRNWDFRRQISFRRRKLRESRCWAMTAHFYRPALLFLPWTTRWTKASCGGCVFTAQV